MIHVKLSVQFPKEWILRQTPGGEGRWGNCAFHVNDQVAECDYWVVYDKPARPESTVCPPENVILITGEPPSVARYHPRFLAQFGLVVTCHEDIEHPRVLLRQQGLPWHVGRRQRDHVNLGFSKSYDELKGTATPPKDRTLSVICSSKDFTDGHCKRNRFVQAIQARFGDRIDVFGRGRKEIEDKWDALAPYKYTVSLENSACPHYWTEKVTDAFLAETFPFYFGCPNLADYFPAEAFQPVDLDSVDRAADMIEARIREDVCSSARPFLRKAKALVLEKYNLFALITDLCRSPVGKSQARVRVYPEEQCRRVLFPWRRAFGRVLRTIRR